MQTCKMLQTFNINMQFMSTVCSFGKSEQAKLVSQHEMALAQQYARHDKLCINLLLPLLLLLQNCKTTTTSAAAAISQKISKCILTCCTNIVAAVAAATMNEWKKLT